MSKKKTKKKNNKANKKKNKSKKKAVTKPDEILESVSDSMEMAGTAMDFFESDEAPEEAAESPVEVLAEDSAEETAEEVVEASEQEASEEELQLTPTEGDGESDFVSNEQAYSIIEGLLFASDKPLGVGTFKQVFHGTNIKTKEIKKLLEEMQSIYAEPIRGVELFEVNGGWQLRTKVDNMDFMRKLSKTRPFKLSGPALEVMAIIAYKQPIIKMEVDQIRGVESGHLVRALMEKGLVCFQGKSELPGKPMQYGTTRKFLEIFGLRNLKELPSLDEIDQLLPDGIGMEEEDEKLSDVTDSLSEQYAGNYSEGEEELADIVDTLGDIDTSSDFFEEEKRRQREKRDRDRAQDIREALEVGEDVPEKDQRWLARYEEKLNEEAAAAEETQPEGAETLQAEEAVASEDVEASSTDEVEASTVDGEEVEAAAADETSETEELQASDEEAADFIEEPQSLPPDLDL